MSAWIGVDLDGTLAQEGDVRSIGAPIAAMVARVRALLASGQDVRIFTARVGPATNAECQLVGARDFFDWHESQTRLIQAWCLEHLCQVLPITSSKDFHMVAYYDDRAVQVETNTGALLQDTLAAYRRALACEGA
jgi:hypothetical protein